jgi:hypothetical protein
LAIYVRNLVPYCHDCNNSKKTHAGGDDKRFIHPYFDAIPDVQFLQATVHLQGGALRVEFATASTGWMKTCVPGSTTNSNV